MKPQTDKTKALEANIAVHSSLASSGEYNRSPHFRPENQAKVRALLEQIVANHSAAGETSLLDLGCGTGFIIHLVHDLVTTVHGVDITEDMMSQVDSALKNVELFNSTAEQTPFEADSYDIVTAYSFLDHVVDYRAVLAEAFRVLKPGGTFYSDLNPNRRFSALMKQAEALDEACLPEIVAREIQGMLHNGEYYEENFGIDRETLLAAEPIKSFDQGIDPYEFMAAARDIGYREAGFTPDWYLGQARVMHGQSQNDSDVVEAYLRGALPATLGLFKYLRFQLVK